MKSLMKEERLTELIRSSIKLMCKTSLDYEEIVQVQGTLGVTIDDKNMFLITVNELIKFENPTVDQYDATTADESSVCDSNHEYNGSSDTVRYFDSVDSSVSASLTRAEKSKKRLKRNSSYMSTNMSDSSQMSNTNVSSSTGSKSKRRKSDMDSASSRSFIDAFLNKDQTVEPVVVAPVPEIKEEKNPPFGDHYANGEINQGHGSPQRSSDLPKPVVLLNDISPKNQKGSSPKSDGDVNNHNRKQHNKETDNSNGNVKKKKIKVALPDFSSVVKKKLQLNQSEVVWNRMIHEAAEYYFTKRPEMLVKKGQDKLFQAVAEGIYNIYPAVGCTSIGKYAWTKFGNDLQSRMLQLQGVESHSGGKNNGRSKSLEVERPKIQDIRSEEIHRMKQLYDELQCTEDKDDQFKLRFEISKSIENTFHKRRKWIENMDESGSVQAILDVFPVFKDPEFVSVEMCLIKGKDTITVVQKKCEDLFEKARDLMPKATTLKGDNCDFEIFKFMEEETSLVQRGNSSGTKSIIKVFENVTDQFIQQTKQSTPPQHSPGLLIFTSEEQIKEAVILTDGEQICAANSSFRKCILSLLYVYYIAWIDYPREFSQVLGLFQQMVLGETFSEKKTNLMNFLRKLEKVKKE